MLRKACFTFVLSALSFAAINAFTSTQTAAAQTAAQTGSAGADPYKGTVWTPTLVLCRDGVSTRIACLPEGNLHCTPTPCPVPVSQ